LRLFARLQSQLPPTVLTVPVDAARATTRCRHSRMAVQTTVTIQDATKSATTTWAAFQENAT
jgi:hypothetical protein